LRGNAPDDVAYIVGDQQRARAVGNDPDRATLRLAVRAEEAGQHVLYRRAGYRLSGSVERHVDDLVARQRLAVL
jgi:hypothetical protein